MKTYTTLNAEKREVGPRSLVKKLLKNNYVPGVIYLKGGKSACISLSSKEMNAIVEDPSAMTRLYEVNYDKKKIVCILKEVQFNPALDLPRSFDLMEVSKGDIVKVNVPVRVLNKEICPGVKNGGDVYILTYNVRLKCEVENIPYAIEIDVKDCDMGQKFFLSDITLPKGCSMINDIILLRIAGRRVIKEAASSSEDASSATATADATTTTATATTSTTTTK